MNDANPIFSPGLSQGEIAIFPDFPRASFFPPAKSPLFFLIADLCIKQLILGKNQSHQSFEKKGKK